jgi:transposase InsO family protein
MCVLARISRASFYRHWEREDPAAEETALRDSIQRLWLTRRPNGYRYLTRYLRAAGQVVNSKKVRRLMREDNLLGWRKRKFVVSSDSEHGFTVYPNLAQNMVLSDLDQLWVADITYLRLVGEFVYLAVILDAYSRRAVGWALDRRLGRALTLSALEQAIQSRQPRPGLVHHSDRGVQYAHDDYVQRVESIGGVLSMSGAGRPWENGKCESFIGTLKREQLDGRPYRSLEELRQHVEEFLETVYNRQRLHSALGYRTPEEFEQQQAERRAKEGWRPGQVSFQRHKEIYSDDQGD